jgi:hypothetical protein
MANRNEHIPFTVGDREDIVETIVLVREMSKKLDAVNPADTEIRVCSLETTRKRAITAVISVLVAVVGGLLLWSLKGLLVSAIVAGAAGVMIP